MARNHATYIGWARYVFGYHLIRTFIRFTPFRIIFRFRVKNLDGLPDEGPVLVLPNHSAALDPWWVGANGGRPMHYMASAQLFRYPALAKFIRFQGAFPKQKYTHDQGAIDTVKELLSHDECVVIFPEGNRTFDGRTGVVRNGIGAFIRELDYPQVVFVRIKSGHLWHPRWAKRLRLVPVHLEYSKVFHFRENSDEEIVEVVRREVSIDPDHFAKEGFGKDWTWGRELAAGLDSYLWACPKCLEPETLEVGGKKLDEIGCRECGARWRLDITNRLHPQGDSDPELTVYQAFNRIEARYGSPPVLDRARYDAENLVFESEGRIGRMVKGAEPERLAQGTLRLYEDRLEVQSEAGDCLWAIALKDLRAASMEFGGFLQLRTLEGELFQLDPRGRGTVLWEHFLAPWIRRARKGG